MFKIFQLSSPRASFRYSLNGLLLLIFVIIEMSIGAISINGHGQNPTRSQSGFPTTKPLKLGVVKESGLLDNCGCSFYLNMGDERKRRPILLCDLSEKAVINLDGKNLSLRLIGHSKEKTSDQQVGDRSWEIYRAGNVKLRIDFTIRKLCDPHDEGCEVTYYDAAIALTRKGQKVAHKTIGLCGC